MKKMLHFVLMFGFIGMIGSKTSLGMGVDKDESVFQVVEDVGIDVGYDFEELIPVSFEFGNIYLDEFVGYNYVPISIETLLISIVEDIADQRVYYNRGLVPIKLYDGIFESGIRIFRRSRDGLISPTID